MASNSLPLVSVVTVNYDQSEVTCEFLESMSNITYPNVEYLVIDNASPNDNPDIIKERYPQITLLKTEKNLGFAGGNNVALPYCKGKYVLFINNDTEVEQGFLEPMIQTLEGDPKIGMVSPRIQYFHQPGIIQYAGFTTFNMITTRLFSYGYGKKDEGQYSQICESGSIFGAAMVVPMKVIKEVGMMADVFFLYYEEHDWAAHIKKAGYKIWYQGNSLVYHKESVATGKDSPFKIYYLTRGRILFARRNTSGLEKLLSMIYLYLITVPRITLGYLLKFRFDHIWAFWKAAWWNLTHHKGIVFGLPQLEESN